MSDPEFDQQTPVKELSKSQRRVLGVLIEKALTTPEVYPLTLKAATTACNQKSNRDPVVNYQEDFVETVFDQLRELGLCAVVHTESGRTARYRHYLRKRFTLSEGQVAILAELLLRGQQSIGELRTRASRMVAIESLEQLRTELDGLIGMDLIRSDAELDRRGVEIDHNLYTSQERQPMRQRSGGDDDSPAPMSSGSTASTPRAVTFGVPAAAAAVPASASSPQLEADIAELRTENEQLRGELQQLREDIRKLSDEFHQLRRDLGG